VGVRDEAAAQIALGLIIRRRSRPLLRAALGCRPSTPLHTSHIPNKQSTTNNSTHI